MSGSERTMTDVRVDGMRARKFRADLKQRLIASGLKVTITVGGLLVEWPNGESCALDVHNRTGRRGA